MFHPIFSLYAAIISCKKSEKLNASISYKTNKKFILGCTLLSVKIFQKNHYINFNFKQKKSEKFHAIIFWKYFKNLVLGSFWTQNFKTKSFPTKSFSSVLHIYAAVNPSKKSEKFYALTFGNTKTSFWALSGAKTLKQSYSQKISFASIVLLYVAVQNANLSFNISKTLIWDRFGPQIL